MQRPSCISQKRGGLVNNNVLSIAGDGSELWFATLGGVSQCTAGQERGFTFKNYSAETGLGSNYIYKVFVDSRNRVWFGTDGKGITMLDKGKFTNYSVKNGLKSNNIYSITEDAGGGIWFSTSNAGIYKLDGKKLVHYSLHNGLRELAITSLAADKLGNVLIVSRQGIDVINTKPVTSFIMATSWALARSILK